MTGKSAVSAPRADLFSGLQVGVGGHSQLLPARPGVPFAMAVLLKQPERIGIGVFGNRRRRSASLAAPGYGAAAGNLACAAIGELDLYGHRCMSFTG